MRTVASTALTALTAGVLLLGAWLVFAPAGLGGGAHVAVVQGLSMEPGLDRGDLVLVRPRGTPGVGDVVLYRNPELGVRVLHRVVRIQDDRLVLKGDANDFLDDAHPRPDEAIGTLWFSVPRVGAALTWLRGPLHATVLAFLLALVALSGGIAVRPGSREQASGR